MKVLAGAVTVRPEADVDLFRRAQCVDYPADVPEEWTKLMRFGLAELGDGRHMAPRSDNQRSNVERTNAVIHDPIGGLEDQATRHLDAPCEQIAPEATINVHAGSLARERRGVSRLGDRGTAGVVRSVASLAFLSQHLSAPSTGFDPLTAFGFEIGECDGEVRVDEADDDVFEAAFVPVERAVERLGLNTFAPSVEPVRAYLSGAVPAGTAWMWSVGEDQGAELRARLEP